MNLNPESGLQARLAWAPEKRKTAHVLQWQAMISNLLQKNRGLDPHNRPKR